MKINIIGNLLGTDGYSNHTRQLFNSLYKLNSDIKLDIPLPQNWVSLVNDAENDAITKPFRIPDVTIMISTPPQWRLALSDGCKKFIGFCVWEGSNIPKYWIEYLIDRRVNQIWVPSQHTKDAILKTFTDYGDSVYDWSSLSVKFVCSLEDIEKKIKIVPHGVDNKLFHPIEK